MRWLTPGSRIRSCEVAGAIKGEVYRRERHVPSDCRVQGATVYAVPGGESAGDD